MCQSGSFDLVIRTGDCTVVVVAGGGDGLGCGLGGGLVGGLLRERVRRSCHVVVDGFRVVRLDSLGLRDRLCCWRDESPWLRQVLMTS